MFFNSHDLILLKSLTHSLLRYMKKIRPFLVPFLPSAWPEIYLKAERQQVEFLSSVFLFGKYAHNEVGIFNG